MEKVSLLLSGDRPRPYVYRLTHRETGRFYIGYRSRNVLLGRHHSLDLGIRYFTSCREITRGTFPEYDAVVLGEFETAEQAFDHEQDLIETNWGNPLLINQFRQKIINTEAKFQYRHSEGAKQKIADAHTGRKRAQEHCRNISKAKLGTPAQNKGKTWTQQQREKIKARKYSSEAIENYSAGQIKRYARPEQQEHLNRLHFLGGAVRRQRCSKVEASSPLGERHVYASIAEFADAFGMKRRIAYHLVKFNDGRAVRSGKLKGYELKLIRFAL